MILQEELAIIEDVSGTELEVIHDIALMQRRGMIKYGMTVAENPGDLRSWMKRTYEDCLNQAIYLKRSMVELDVQISGQETFQF